VLSYFFIVPLAKRSSSRHKFFKESKIYLGRLVQNQFWTPNGAGVQDLSWAPRPKSILDS